MMNFHRGSNVTLRKPRRCEWCGGAMDQGADAYRGRGVFDGDFYDYRMHPECAEDMNDTPYISEDGFMPYENERPMLADVRPK